MIATIVRESTLDQRAFTTRMENQMQRLKSVSKVHTYYYTNCIGQRLRTHKPFGEEMRRVEKYGLVADTKTNYKYQKLGDFQNNDIPGIAQELKDCGTTLYWDHNVVGMYTAENNEVLYIVAWLLLYRHVVMQFMVSEKA